MPKWADILQSSPLPVIVTNRAKWEGGNSSAPEEQRLSVLLDAISLNAAHVDVELKAAELFRSLCEARNLPMPFPTTKLILSHHNFSRPLTSEEVASVHAEMIVSSADVCKIAMATSSALDNELVFRTLQDSTVPTIMLAMGDMGQVSRIVAPKFGAYLTFASVGRGKESAPGQVDTETLNSLYRFRDISADTPVYGVIGNPVSHSMSPALHNTALAVTNTPGVYVPLKVESDFAPFIRKMTAFGFDGFSITIPGKVPSMEGVDEMDEIATKIGAMNTVVKQADGRLKGYNTDWVAAISAIEEKVDNGMLGKRVVCIGAGGAGRGLAFGALERGASHVTVVNRSAEKAIALAKELGDCATGTSLEDFNSLKSIDYDVLMNSTSVGMHPNVDVSPVEDHILVKGAVVFDAVYNPLQTRLLREAEEKGCITVSGLEMFVRQAAEQFRLWFPGVEVPVQTMRTVVLEKLAQ